MGSHCVGGVPPVEASGVETPRRSRTRYRCATAVLESFAPGNPDAQTFRFSVSPSEATALAPPQWATVYTQVYPERVSSQKRWIQTGKVHEPK